MFKNRHELAGLLSGQNLRDQHPEIALQWIHLIRDIPLADEVSQKRKPFAWWGKNAMRITQLEKMVKEMSDKTDQALAVLETKIKQLATKSNPNVDPAALTAQIVQVVTDHTADLTNQLTALQGTVAGNAGTEVADVATLTQKIADAQAEADDNYQAVSDMLDALNAGNTAQAQTIGNEVVNPPDPNAGNATAGSTASAGSTGTDASAQPGANASNSATDPNAPATNTNNAGS